MRTIILLAIGCVLLLVSTTAADPGDTLWTRTYGGSNDEEGYSVQQTTDGGYIIAGYTESFGAGDSDVYLVKTDSSGDTLWTRTYGGSRDDQGYSVQQTSDGGYIIAGYTFSFPGYEDVYLVKTDSSGHTLWTSTYGGDWRDEGFSVQQTSDGGYIIAGLTYSFGAGPSDVYLVKTDSSGNTLWTRTYGGSDHDWGRSVQQTSDGGYIIAGWTMSFGVGRNDDYLVKTDSSGDTLWTRSHGGIYYDAGESVQQTSDGGYIIAGSTYSFGAGNDDVYLVKTHVSGTLLWIHTYGGSDWDRGYSVQQTSDGGYIVAGYTMSFGAGYQDVYLVKTGFAGTPLWTRTYGGSGDDAARSVQQTSDGGYIIAGNTESFGAGESDVYLVRVAGEPGGVVMDCEVLSPTFCKGKHFYFAVTYNNATQSPINTVVTLRGYSGFDCDPGNILITIPKNRTIPIGTNTYYYFLKVPGGISGDLSASLEFEYQGTHSCCMNTTAIQCQRWTTGLNNEWEWGEVSEQDVVLSCEALTPTFCRGKDFYFTTTVTNNTGGNVSGQLTFSGYSGYGCDPGNVLAQVPANKSYSPGVTETHYFFKVPSAAVPGPYSTSVSGSLSGHGVFCCMDVDIIQCGGWRIGDNTEWELVEVDSREYVSSLPSSPSLSQCYPNPFNAKTVIEYELPEASEVTLHVYNLIGEKVATLVNGAEEAGYKSVTWDASEVSSGLYFYKLTAGDYTETMRMILVK